jgi:hypothetical protein
LDALFSITDYILWSFLLGFCIFGYGSLFSHKKALHPILILSLGQAILGCLCTFTLFFSIDSKVVYPTLLIIGTVIGFLKALKHLKSMTFNFDKTECCLLLLLSLVLICQWVVNLAPIGGQESFQYHYFLPQLYLEQQSLGLKGFELYDALINVWGMESLMSFSLHHAGFAGMRIQMWWLYALFLMQIYLSASWLWSRQVGLWSSVMASICTMFTYFFWWTKPELALVGYSALLLAYWKKHDEHETTSKLFDVTMSSILIAWLFSLKITFILLIPILFIAIVLTKRFKFKWMSQVSSLTMFLFLPWIIFNINNQGGLGVFPMDNPMNFDAPLGKENIWFISPYQKFFDNLWFTLKLFKPASYLFLIALPLFIIRFKTFDLLVLGFLANLIAAALLMKADTPFADEFRYVSFTLFVIPMGAGVVVKTLSQWKWMNVCLLCLCGFMVIKRSSIQLQETWRHHGAWLKGNKTLGEALSREGYDQAQVFKSKKMKAKPYSTLVMEILPSMGQTFCTSALGANAIQFGKLRPVRTSSNGANTITWNGFSLKGGATKVMPADLVGQNTSTIA